MPSVTAAAHIRTTRAHIRMAQQLCSTTNFDHLRRALDLLQTAESEMRLAVASAVSSQHSGVRRETVRHETALLQRETACLMRVVDGCAALHRGLSVRLGVTSLTYSPRGCAVNAPAAAACEMQG